jgi:hypothetical protein
MKEGSKLLDTDQGGYSVTGKIFGTERFSRQTTVTLQYHYEVIITEHYLPPLLCVMVKLAPNYTSLIYT